MKEMSIDIRPELFGDKRSRIDSDIQSPLRTRIRQASFLRGVVSIRQTRRCARTYNLAQIYNFRSRI